MIVQEHKPLTLSPLIVLKSVGPKLVPFIKTTVVYFVAWLPTDSPSFFAAFIKCLPVLCLIAFVLFQGMSANHHQHKYRRYILLGLILSVIGDALLIWHETQFISAMASFGFAHLAYIYAFALESKNCWLKSFPFVAFAFYGMYMLSPGLSGILFPCVTIYVILLNTMAWRAFAHVDLMQNVWSWTKLCACFGAFLFLISDFVIGLNKFSFEVPAARVIIMVTYYTAQCFIALSAANTDSLVRDLKMKKI